MYSWRKEKGRSERAKKSILASKVATLTPNGKRVRQSHTARVYLSALSVFCSRDDDDGRERISIEECEQRPRPVNAFATTPAASLSETHSNNKTCRDSAPVHMDTRPTDRQSVPHSASLLTPAMNPSACLFPLLFPRECVCAQLSVSFSGAGTDYRSQSHHMCLSTISLTKCQTQMRDTGENRDT